MGVLAFVAVLSAFTPPARVFLGEPSNPVVSGHVWLVANCWGYYPGVLVATIRDGHLERRPLSPARRWEEAFDYKLVVGVSGQPAPDTAAAEVEDGYGFFESPGYLKSFQVVYVSPPLDKAQLGADWPDAFAALGRADPAGMVLPRPSRRTLRLLFPDGRPLTGTSFALLLYGSNRNHCGAPRGIELGSFRTDSRGEVSLLSTGGALALRIYHFEEKAGSLFFARDSIVTDAGPAITLRSWWNLPEYDYVVTVQTADGRPIGGAHLEGCMYVPCGAGCGFVGTEGSATDSFGVLRFHAADLRRMESMTVVLRDGKRRELTAAEMSELLGQMETRIKW